jgi:23S rRNA (pseudouridine1915-N3)-methyltransferase
MVVLWVGRRAPEALTELIRPYAARLARFGPFAEQQVRPALGRDGDPRRALAAEAASLRRYLQAGDTVVALDQAGRSCTSEELAQLLERWRGRGRVVFAVGGDLGLDEAFKRAANERLAISHLTLPHQLARLVLLEQLYRACDILAGGRYHRGSGGKGLGYNPPPGGSVGSCR